MKTYTFIFFLCGALFEAESYAMYQQSVRSIGPIRNSLQDVPFTGETGSKREKLVAVDLSNTKPHSSTKLPEKLFEVYAPFAKLAKKTGSKVVNKDKIERLVELNFKNGTAAQKEVTKAILYEDLLEGPLERSSSTNTSLKKRIEIILDIKSRMQNRGKNEPIVFTSIISAQVLQEYWTVRELQADGFKNITVNLINPALYGEFAHHESEEVDYYYLMNKIEDLSKRTGLPINQFDLTQKIVPEHINIFSNAYNYYIRAHLQNTDFKSSIMTMLYPMHLQNAAKTELPNVLAIYIDEQKEEEEENNDMFANILISFTNKKRPELYMQPIESTNIVEIIGKISDFMKYEIDPFILKKQLKEQFPEIEIVAKANPLSIFAEMITLSLAERGTGYILADQLEPIKGDDIRVITKDNFNPQAYQTEVEAAQQHYVRALGYIDVF
jgi:hypothetical protein